MGRFINGTWHVQKDFESDEAGAFKRQETTFRQQLSPQDIEANRYHLYVSYACPWASRTIIMRALKNLEPIISMSVTDAYMGEKGWTFGQEGRDTQDDLYHVSHLGDLYLRADANYSGRVTVPVLWDKKYQTIVNNESSDIMRILNSAFDTLTNVKYDFYPSKRKDEIDELNRFIYDNINNGVYKCGFAKNQTQYDKAFDALFNALNEIEVRLEKNRYLLGDDITETDWRLFTTLIRFDAVYHTHFKCNLKQIDDYENLSGYMKELYQMPKIAETVNFQHIKTHYYTSHPMINPKGIIAKGPVLHLTGPHGRDLKFDKLKDD